MCATESFDTRILFVLSIAIIIFDVSSVKLYGISLQKIETCDGPRRDTCVETF